MKRERLTPVRVRAKAAYALADLALEQGDHRKARRRFEDALAAYERLDDGRMIAWTLLGLGNVACVDFDLQRADLHWNDGLALAREIGDAGAVVLLTLVLAWSALSQGDDERASDGITENLAICRELGDVWNIADGLHVQARLALRRGDLATAWDRLVESLDLFQQFGDKRGIAYCLETFAGLLAARGQMHGAARLDGAATALRHSIGRPRHAFESPMHVELLAPARARLDEAAWEAAFAEGASMQSDEAIAVALADSLANGGEDKTADAPSEHQLTPRQIEVLRLVAEGMSDRQIAERLFLSPYTVMRHVANILNTLGVDSRTAAAAHAIRRNLI